MTDVVVEWAGSGQQRLIDRYVLGLEPIPDDSLAPIWLDTDTPTLWTTLPQVRQFLRTLRDVNSTLPAAKRIRLLGGNDGVDWTAGHPRTSPSLRFRFIVSLSVMKLPDRRLTAKRNSSNGLTGL